MTKFLIICLLFLFGCNISEQNKNNSQEHKKNATANTKNIAAAPVLISGCYGWKVNKDSATLKLYILGNKVTGNLKYYWYEKDYNGGILKGILKDNIIDAEYTFVQSEGVTSVREVVFKKQGESLVEGYGDMYMSGDTVKFKNISLLKFQVQRPFVKKECR